MGIDYRAHYGIGYEVEETEEISELEGMEDGLMEYLECELGEGFECFRSGSAYSGEYDGIFVIITAPFKDGLDLTKAKDSLDKELERIKVEVVTEFREVGGLLVY